MISRSLITERLSEMSELLVIRDRSQISLRGTKLAPFRSHDHIVQNLRNKFDLRINLEIDCASDSFISIPVKVLEKLNNILSFFLFSLKFVSIVTVFVFFHCFTCSIE